MDDFISFDGSDADLSHGEMIDNAGSSDAEDDLNLDSESSDHEEDEEDDAVDANVPEFDTFFDWTEMLSSFDQPEDCSAGSPDELSQRLYFASHIMPILTQNPPRHRAGFILPAGANRPLLFSMMLDSILASSPSTSSAQPLNPSSPHRPFNRSIALLIVPDAIRAKVYQSHLQNHFASTSKPWQIGCYFGMGLTPLHPTQFFDPRAIELVQTRTPNERLLALPRDQLISQISELLALSEDQPALASEYSKKVCKYE